LRTFDTLEKAAQNEGGGAGQLLGAGLGIGAGLGAGIPIGQQIAGAMNVQNQSSASTASDDHVAKLQKLKQMLDSGLITQQEYEEKKKQIIDSL
jgi:membrane protease subunit (stomatin/prohibitin family)